MLLQLFVLVAAPVLDAQLEHASEVALHIEDAQDPGCPQAHLADDCGLCQLQAIARLLVAKDLGATAPVLRRAQTPQAPVVVAVAATRAAEHGSRAPPQG